MTKKVKHKKKMIMNVWDYRAINLIFYKYGKKCCAGCINELLTQSINIGTQESLKLKEHEEEYKLEEEFHER